MRMFFEIAILHFVAKVNHAKRIIQVDGMGIFACKRYENAQKSKV